MTIFKKIINSLQRSRQREALYYLENLSERQLIDCGFSPELLSQGLNGWPWRTESTAPSAVKPMISMEQQHISELQSYSDSELADLGLHRGAIKDSVRNGRPGIERPMREKAA